MKHNLFPAVAAILTTVAIAAFAGEPLTKSTFTDVVKDVNVVDAQSKAASPAAVNTVVTAPNLVRTGPQSRAELTAPDNTITRIGANSVFSFEPANRVLDLQSGSVLFQSPKGKGGGIIKSGGASAAVLGTTVICVKGSDGTFKTILLEGEVKVTLADGKSVTLHDGQMVIVSSDGTKFSKIYDVDLHDLTLSSLLVTGFSHDLPSWPLILDVIHRQELAAGHGNPPPKVDNNSYQTLVFPNFDNSPRTANPNGGPVIPTGKPPQRGR